MTLCTSCKADHDICKCSAEALAKLKTLTTHPDHDVVGHYHHLYDGVYLCESYDPRWGYWMQNIATPERRNVSERYPRYGNHAHKECPHKDHFCPDGSRI